MHHINPVCVMGGVRSFKCIKSGLSLKPLAEEYTHTHKKKKGAPVYEAKGRYEYAISIE